MKSKILAALVALAPFNLAHAQQGAETGKEATGETKASSSKSEVKSAKASEQKQVLDRIHAINQEEIKGGTIAEKNGSSEGVKEYGRMLKNDHGAADAKVKKVAENLNYTLKDPGAQTAKKEEKLKSLHGKEFDKIFLDEMIKDHEDAIAELTKAEKQLKNTETGNLIEELLPELKQHLTKAESLEKAEVAH